MKIPMARNHMIILYIHIIVVLYMIPRILPMNPAYPQKSDNFRPMVTFFTFRDRGSVGRCKSRAVGCFKWRRVPKLTSADDLHGFVWTP